MITELTQAQTDSLPLIRRVDTAGGEALGAMANQWTLATRPNAAMSDAAAKPKETQ